MLTAVVDSSPLIALDHLGLAPKLSQFFDLIYVPSEVEKEITRKHRFRYRLKALYASGAFARCKSANETNRKLLQDDRKIGAGEADAITQAQERGIPFLIADEKTARQIARNMQKQLIGTLGVLARLHLEGLAAHPKELTKKLRRDLNYRVSEQTIEDALKAAEKSIFLAL